MAKVYKIHPGIGVARVGDSSDAFFIGPEIPGERGVVPTPKGEQPVERYKDASGRILRQAARFRVYEYERTDKGALRLLREITAADAEITWHVRLANRKAASKGFASEMPRNPDVPEEELVIAPVFDPIVGANQTAVASRAARFMGTEVYLGELRTDAAGRLLVLGGHGHSASVPTGKPINSFANNPGWHDDVSDGPVTATIRLPNGETREVDAPSWVIVAPPDYAPAIGGITTLYDIAVQASVTRGFEAPPATPSFKRDILPILNRASRLRWVEQWAQWNSIPRDWTTLSRKGDPAASALRQTAYALVKDAQDSGILNDFMFTEVQLAALDAWLAENFVDDASAPEEPIGVTPGGLDRAALDACVGGGFYPGIEAGEKMKTAAMYAERCRLTTAPFVNAEGEQETLVPGALTARMAVPWQADFLKCGVGWWPSQRPSMVMRRPDDATPSAGWTRDIDDHTELVEKFGRLGIIVPRRNAAGEEVLLEAERSEI
ncbi:LodA/GoxA family CTQ-dependent oxidase [Polyangium jinanense]|uniref:LodA/GoxA family CTQ-dependent oxidase n=1 Tax=Polyangium jinanense TaxID=2829994 RepID=A0A9X3XCA2_9BACT|nr:LodA/GoxA family CTQ-dependent oxidase [Polyangium jinanense]MDC3960236.1 LodA/GoxA family CTQ-dependent oxidase [Polyangium jinanense]MDC3988044.1 LodA/GoxA family CTQ-dependent oxidase [Polyangium jinanense]